MAWRMAFWRTPRVQRVQLSSLQDPFPRESAAPLALVPPVPSEQPLESRLLARAPVVDRYPFVIGQGLTSSALTTTYRLANTGWRFQFVDLLNELFEHDAHARGVTRQRVLAVAGGRVEVLAAKLRKNHPEADKAQQIAEEFAEQFEAIPARTQALSQLNWAVVYGVTASETSWETDPGWTPVGLSHIHTRRLNYPDPTSWDLRIYDQGLVGPGFNMGLTNGVYGLRIADFPGKFIVHTPALNADYPTRDGEGRYIGIYMLLKRMVMRATAQDFERTIRPWLIGYFNRAAEMVAPGGKPRSIANPEDEAALAQALQLLGSGGKNFASLPDSVRIELLKAASALSATEFLSFLNREMSKAMLGQAFTTEPGANGNLSTSQMAKEGTMEILRYDARCLADTLERDLIGPWVRLNHPEVRRTLHPRIVIHVDEIPDPEKVMKIAVQGTSIDMPIDVDKLAEQTGMPLVQAEEADLPRRTRMVAAGKAPEPEGEENSVADGPRSAVDAQTTKKPNGAKSNGKPAAEA